MRFTTGPPLQHQRRPPATLNDELDTLRRPWHTYWLTAASPDHKIPCPDSNRKPRLNVSKSEQALLVQLASARTIRVGAPGRAGILRTCSGMHIVGGLRN